MGDVDESTLEMMRQFFFKDFCGAVLILQASEAQS